MHAVHVLFSCVSLVLCALYAYNTCVQYNCQSTYELNNIKKWRISALKSQPVSGSSAAEETNVSGDGRIKNHPHTDLRQAVKCRAEVLDHEQSEESIR